MQYLSYFALQPSRCRCDRALSRCCVASHAWRWWGGEKRPLPLPASTGHETNKNGMDPAVDPSCVTHSTISPPRSFRGLQTRSRTTFACLSSLNHPPTPLVRNTTQVPRLTWVSGGTYTTHPEEPAGSLSVAKRPPRPCVSPHFASPARPPGCAVGLSGLCPSGPLRYIAVGRGCRDGLSVVGRVYLDEVWWWSVVCSVVVLYVVCTLAMHGMGIG